MFNIRQAQESDIPEIINLFRETVLTINMVDYSKEQIEYWIKRGTDENKWKLYIKDHYFIVAEEKNIITGFAAVKPDGYLNLLYIHENYQRQGIASILLNYVEKYIKKNHIPEVIADVSITAKPFFEKMGFKVIKEQTVNIGVNLVNYKMIKKLEEI